ncbi:MAG: TolC family protein [Bacteroidota bacterium]
MKRLKILIVLLIIDIAGFAQQNQKLTLQDAIKMGLENSKNLKLSSAKIDAANAKYYQSIDATIPSLKLYSGYTRQSDIEAFKAQFPGNPEPVTFYPNIPNNYSSRASLSETVFSGFRLKYAQASQKFLQQAVSLDAQKDSDEVIFNIVNAYYNLYKIKQSQNIVTDNLELVKQHLTDAVNWEKNGIATHNEVLKWQLQQSNVELTQLDLENNLNVVNYNMNLMFGMNGDTKIEVDSASMFSSKDFKSLQDYMQQAFVNRGDLLAIDFRNESFANALKVSQNSYYPNIAVGANYYYSRPNQRIFPLKDGWHQTWDAGVTLSWDITNFYTNKHNVAEARANLSQTEQQKNILSDAIKMEVNQNYLTYIEAKKKIEVIEKSVTQADENYRITDNKYNNQLVLQSELFDADNALLQSKINLILAQSDSEVAYYKLLKSVGCIQ